MFSETSCSVLFSCKMRKFVTRQPCWDQLRKYQAPPTKQQTCLLTLVRIDDDSIFVFELICSPTLHSSFFPQNSDPLSVARQQSVIINAGVCVGYLEVVPHMRTKQSWRLWMKWSKNSPFEMFFLVWEYEWFFQGSLPHMLSTVL